METTGSLSNGLALGLTLVLGAIVVADVRADLPRLLRARNVVLISIFIWYLLEALLVPRELCEYSQERYRFGLFCVALAAGSFLTVYHLSAPQSLRGLGQRLASLDRPEALWKIVGIGALIGFLPVLICSQGDIVDVLSRSFALRNGSVALGRGRYGGARDAFLELQMFVKGVAPFAMLLLLQRTTPVWQRLVCIAVIAWPILRSFGTGTRHTLFLALVPVLAAVYWKASPFWRRLLLWSALPLVFIAFKFSAAMVESRNSGSFQWEAADRAEYVGYEMFRELLFITEKVPDEMEYQLGYGYYVQAVNPIPRALWPDKPVLESGILLAQMAGATDEKTGDVYMTRSPGILGEMYLNFGIVGIIVLSGAGGWVIRAWDTLIDEHIDSPATMVVFSVGLGAIFFLGRSLNMPVCYALFSLLAMIYLFVPHPGAAATGVEVTPQAVQPG